MSNYRNIRHMLITAAAALALTVPIMASATTISLSGTLDDVSGFGTAPFAVGDSVTGSFDVDLQADNSFGAGDLNFFNLAVGSNAFSLMGSDFTNFAGSLASDASTVDSLTFLTSGFPTASNGTAANLAFDIDNQPFTITSFTNIGTATLAANVADNNDGGGNGGGVAVPEPREIVMFGFALILLGVGAMTRRRLG